jgi:hypothetical protein
MRLRNVTTLFPSSTTSSTASPARAAAPKPEAASHRFTDSFKAVIAPEKRPNLLSLEKLLPKSLGEQRTEADALREAELLLLGGPANRQENGADVLRDAPDVNSSSDTAEASARHQAAQAQLEANQALEDARLAKLSAEDRAKYQAVKQRCLDANDPVAALALQKMLFEGKLPGAKDLAGEGTTLDHLASLADDETPLAEGVDRNRLVTDLVQELATPSAINQGPRGTCAPTTIAIQLAMNHPAEYARIAASLASSEGQVRLAGGQVLTREDGTAADDGTGRSVTQRLIGSAFMELANGDRDYDNASGEGAGAWSNDLDRLYEAVLGRRMSDRRLTTDEDRAWAMGVIDTQLRAGASVPVALSWRDGYHKVLVTGTETVDGVEYVKYVNPWGREERMPRAEFEARLADISYDPVAQVTGTVLRAVDGVRRILEKLDPKDLEAQVRANRFVPIAG